MRPQVTNIKVDIFGAVTMSIVWTTMVVPKDDTKVNKQLRHVNKLLKFQS
jgi:hypothetical protein